tara:strand:- start:353 stop:694 length:342 start_codon:yes stop_codon:yes gene_type:complete
MLPFFLSMKLPISKDPISKKETYMKWDGDDATVITEQKVDHIIKSAQAQNAEYKKGSMIGHTQRHQQKVAEIPTTLYFDLIKKLGDPKHNAKAWKRWLNDPDNRLFRTGGGNV